LPRDGKTILKTLAENVSATRRKKGLTQVALSQHSGVNLATIRDLERGRYNTTILTLLRVADALDVDLDTLVSPAGAARDRDPGKGEDEKGPESTRSPSL
jgi:transcriptional regulator with XRE-family HTH domain